MKTTSNSGFGLVHLVIGTGVMAAVLMVLAQYLVNVKDHQKGQREKLAFLEIVRQINDILDRPVSCSCNFQHVTAETRGLSIEEIKVFSDIDCGKVLKIVASGNEKYDGVTLSMSMDNFRETGDAEFLADFHVLGERGTNAAKKKFSFDRTMRFSKVADATGVTRQKCEF
jgi:hypothetical protein